MDQTLGEVSPITDVLPAQAGGFDRILGLVDAGGPVVMILLGFSVAALAIVLLKLWQFRALRLADRRPARQAVRLWRAGCPDEALTLLSSTANPTAQVLLRAMRGLGRRDLAEIKVREEAVRHGEDLLEALRSYLRPLEVIANLAPLLGLFGTVLGMISAFQQMEAAGNQVNPAVLSGGIWEALLTTAVGLAVAIPVVAVLNWLERVVERQAHEMDSAVTQLFTVDLAVPRQDEPQDAPRYLNAIPATAGE